MIYKLMVLACLTQPTQSGYVKECTWGNQGRFVSYATCSDAGERLMLANPDARPGEKREDWDCKRSLR